MVVLALAIGVAEQDDFANIPDLQDTAQAAPPANQEAPPEKRYRVMHECLLCVTEWRAKGLRAAGRISWAASEWRWWSSSAVAEQLRRGEQRHSPAAWQIKSQLNVA